MHALDDSLVLVCFQFMNPTVRQRHCPPVLGSADAIPWPLPVSRYHSGPGRPYQCEYEGCSSSFSHVTSLRNHEVKKHGRPVRYKHGKAGFNFKQFMLNPDGFIKDNSGENAEDDSIEVAPDNADLGESSSPVFNESTSVFTGESMPALGRDSTSPVATDPTCAASQLQFSDEEELCSSDELHNTAKAELDMTPDGTQEAAMTANTEAAQDTDEQYFQQRSKHVLNDKRTC